MINRVVLVGRLTRDPELRKTNSGNAVCSFTVAVDNIQKNPDGTKSTTFAPCVVWSQAADNTAKYAKKGMLVGVEGRLNQRSYVRQDGSKATIFEIVCDRVQFLEKKDASIGESVNDNAHPIDDAPVNSENSANIDSLDLSDDLPF